MVTALQHIADGTWTQADIAYVKADPEIAASVPDPSAPVESGSSTGRDLSAAADSGVQIAAASCGHSYEAWFRYRTTLGSTAYKYHHKVIFCKTGTRITSWSNRWDYWTEPDLVLNWRERTQNQQGGIGTSTAWSKMARHIEWCVVRYGCYANTYPWVQLNVRANGNNTYSGDAG